MARKAQLWFHPAPDPLLPWYAKELKHAKEVKVHWDTRRASAEVQAPFWVCSCSLLYDSLKTQFTYPSNNCDLVEAANATTISEFGKTTKTDDTGFIAIDKLHKVIFLSFRGSRPKKNWFADLDIAKRQTALCYRCRVHQGFWNSWTEAAPGASILPQSNRTP